MYGPRGAGNFLGRATTIVASMFMFTSISLAWYSSDRVQAGSNIEDAIERLEGADGDDGFGIPMPAPAAPEGIEEAVKAAQEALEAQDADQAPVGTPAGEQSTDGTPQTGPTDTTTE